MKFRLILFSSFIFSIGFSQPEKVLEEWKKDKSLKNASYGFSVLDCRTGSVLSAYNASLSLIPASSQKIFCTFAALKILGSDFRYQTQITYTGKLDQSSGVLNGDIVIVGSGDPSLQSDLFDKSSLCDKWAAAIAAKGIKRVTGKIIGDASYYTRVPQPSWLWEDVCNYYGSAPCGLNYMDNKFSLFYSTAEKDSKAKLLSTSPNYSKASYSISTEVFSSGSRDEAYVFGDPSSFTRTVKGNLPANQKKYEIEASLPDPALLCAEHLLASLVKAGIKCEGEAVSDYSQREGKRELLHTHYSPTLDKLVYFTNQKSNNLFCESLMRTLGKGDVEAGLLAIKKSIGSFGLDTTELFQADACGLSRLNSCTPNLQAQLLVKIKSDAQLATVFLNSFPVAGANGTLYNTGKGTILENNLKAKSGYVQRARSYCGYLRSKSGRELSFSVIINNYSCSAKEAKVKLEKFLLALAEL